MRIVAGGTPGLRPARRLGWLRCQRPADAAKHRTGARGTVVEQPAGDESDEEAEETAAEENKFHGQAAAPGKTASAMGASS